MRVSLAAVAATLLLAVAVLSVLDLQRAEARTLVVYTTPALKDLFEEDLAPRFQRASGLRIETVYVAAGQQYNRLRMGGAQPEADVFVHASPLFIEKGYADGRFAAVRVEAAERANATFLGRDVDGGRVWYAFAWTPVVEVYAPRFDAPPDLARDDVRFGLAHPRLSNNGIYNVLFFEELDPEAGKHALARTTVQPTNARTSISAIADGSFDVTLGYEAVTLFYRAKGADVEFALPEMDGRKVFLPAVIAVGVVAGKDTARAQEFLEFLLAEDTQSRLARAWFRPVLGDAVPAGGVDVAGAEPLLYDWSRWERLEAKLEAYEVRS